MDENVSGEDERDDRADDADGHQPVGEVIKKQHCAGERIKRPAPSVAIWSADSKAGDERKTAVIESQRPFAGILGLSSRKRESAPLSGDPHMPSPGPDQQDGNRDWAAARWRGP